MIGLGLAKQVGGCGVLTTEIRARLFGLDTCGGIAMRHMLKRLSLGALVAIMLIASPAPAREQDDDAGVCWDPDIEFPVPCDEDEE